MKRLLFASALTVLAGCSTPLQQLRQELGPRASKYLECDEQKLEYKELERVISSTKVRVSGCGKQAIYRLVESRWTLEQQGGN